LSAIGSSAFSIGIETYHFANSYCFVDFENAESAIAAIKTLDGHRMDKSHVLAVNRLTDVEKYSAVNDEYVEPEQEEFVQKEHLRSWLTDPQARDQWVMYRGDDVSIFWNRKTETPEHEYSRTVSVIPTFYTIVII
jgi:translation initiation factor 3 subunit B